MNIDNSTIDYFYYKKYYKILNLYFNKQIQ